MELTPQLLETQQFPEKWRGYDQDAVDEFLERVGVGLGQLQDRLRTTVSKLKELEAGAGQPGGPPIATQSDTRSSARNAKDQQFDEERSSSGTGADVSAVARALVIAQEASEAALREAKSEGARITADAKAEAAVMLREAESEAKRLTSEAERRHEAATSRLDEADATATKKAEEALRSARGEAEQLVRDAEKAAAVLTSEAKVEADRVTASASEMAERRASELAAKRSDELKDLDDEVGRRRREAVALQAEINNRQVELRSVIEGLQSLVGRVGSLAGDSAILAGDSPVESGVPGGAVPTTEPEAPEHREVASVAEVESVTEVVGPPETVGQPDSAEEPESTPLKKPGAVVIDLTSDDTSPDRVSGAVGDAESQVPVDDSPVQRSPKWANVDSSTKQLTDRRGLSVVGADSDVEDAAATTAVAEQTPSRRSRVGAEKGTSTLTSSDRDAAADDPFLAALRGPDRVEFDDDGELDPDQSSFKRRRRRRL